MKVKLEDVLKVLEERKAVYVKKVDLWGYTEFKECILAMDYAISAVEKRFKRN